MAERKSLAIGFLAVVGMVTLSFSLALVASGEHAYAQKDQSPSPTPQVVQECKALGISPEKCSEAEILKHRCLGGPGIPCGPSSTTPPPELDPFVAEILAGSGMAFVASIFGIRRLRAVKKKKRLTEGKNNSE